jgi:hypothetical protein
MDLIPSLENLKSVLISKFQEELSVQLVKTSPDPLLLIEKLKPTDLKFVPAFHVVVKTSSAVVDTSNDVVEASNNDTKFLVQLLSFHGNVLVRCSTYKLSKLDIYLRVLSSCQI